MANEKGVEELADVFVNQTSTWETSPSVRVSVVTKGMAARKVLWTCDAVRRACVHEKHV